MLNWQDYAPKTSFSIRESTEWSTTYTFNSEDHEKPRVLLIGDSICADYQRFVTQKLNGKVNVTFWASSKCATHPDYFRELYAMASMIHYDIICYNNGLHSLSADRAEWETSYRNAVRMIRDLNPEAVLFLTLSTPLQDAEKTAISAALNDIVLKIAGETGLSVIDLFTPMDALDRSGYWRDCYHFRESAIEMQAEIITKYVLSVVEKSVMESVYEKIRTPYKFGAVLKFEDFYCDSPVVFRYGDRFLMSFVKIDKQTRTGYTTHLAESSDLLHWKVLGQILKGDNGWDSRQTGGYAQFQNPDFYGDCRLSPIDGSYRFAYLGGNLSGYETDPLMMGYASVEDPTNPDGYVKNPQPILRPDDPDARYGETKTLYKPCMFRDERKTLGYPYVCAYNAKNDTGRESIFLAVSEDGEHWKRYGDSAVISAFDCPDTARINGDPQIVMIDGHYVMFYFCYETGKGAYDTFAVSDDLLHWTKWQGEPLVSCEYEWENVHAHKPWVICVDGTVYHYYCAVNDRNERYIALAASRQFG